MYHVILKWSSAFVVEHLWKVASCSGQVMSKIEKFTNIAVQLLKKEQGLLV